MTETATGAQQYVPAARPLRGDGQKRACPTWHGGVAYQPTAYKKELSGTLRGLPLFWNVRRS